MNSLKTLKYVGIALAVVVVGVAVGWLGTRGSQSPAEKTAVAPEAVTPAQNTTPNPSSPSAPAPQASTPSTVVMHQEGAAAASSTTNRITDWEDRVDNILSGEGDEAEKAKKMLEMFPRLPEEGQSEVAQHLANLTPDSDYGSLANYLTNSATSEAVLDVLMGDLLNRPNSVKLPTLVGIARDSQNPKAGEAKDLLQLYLEEDYGGNWDTWQSKVQEWLEKNPD